MARIRINGKETEITSAMTIAGLVKQKGLSPAKIVVEYNRNIVDRKDWDSFVLRDNDEVEIVSFVGGG